jgi:hypothetical protein
MHMRTHLLNTLLIAGIAGLSFASSTASASVIFLTGNNPQPGEQNVLFNGDDRLRNDQHVRHVGKFFVFDRTNPDHEFLGSSEDHHE